MTASWKPPEETFQEKIAGLRPDCSEVKNYKKNNQTICP